LGQSWDNQIANFSAVARLDLGLKCVYLCVI